jgi:GNAT superfamily N-acetyltransferase
LDVAFRELGSEDEELLYEYLYLTLFVPRGRKPFPRAIVRHPSFARYVAGWGREHDVGYLALASAAGPDIGAAWFRLWQGGETGFGYYDSQTPELCIAVRPAYRGMGIGSALLKLLLSRADLRYPTVSLSVPLENPAVRLYERYGFAAVSLKEGSLLMLRCASPPGS